MATIFYPPGGYEPFPITSHSVRNLSRVLGGDVVVRTLPDQRQVITRKDTARLRENERVSSIIGLDVSGIVVLCAPGELGAFSPATAQRAEVAHA